MRFTCQICDNHFNSEEEMSKHFLAECNIPKDKINYWRQITKIAFENVIKQIVDGNLPSPKNLTIEELRALLLLHSVGFIENMPHYNLTPKQTSILLARYAPEALIAIMEYAHLINENSDGTWSLSKNEF